MTESNSRDLVLCVPCSHDGDHSFVLYPPQGRHSFRVIVRCQDSKPETLPKRSSRFRHFAAATWALLSRLIF